MKIREVGAETAQRQPAAARGQQTNVQAAQGEAAVQLYAQQVDIDQSPRLLAQRRALDAAFSGAIQRKRGVLEDEQSVQGRTAPMNETGMPDQLKAGIEALSGMDMSDVRVHRNSDKPAQLNALAYAQGNDIHLGPGQEQHLPHEAWHVVQQRQGMVQPTMQLAGVGVNDDEGLEREADTMGMKALRRTAQMRSRAAVVPSTPRSSPAPIQRIDVGYAPANPATFRTTTTIAGLGGTPASNKPFSNTQRPQILANNVANGGGAAPVHGAGNNPRDDWSNGALLDRAIVSTIEPEIDHIVPRAEGGANDFSNARVLSKNNNLNAAVQRPNNVQKVFRLYETITLSANIPQPGQPNYVLAPIQILAGTNLQLAAAQLLALYANLPRPIQVTDFGQAGADAIKNLNTGTNNGVTIV